MPAIANRVANEFAPKTPFFIGVEGGTASGKSTICQIIVDSLSHDLKRQVAVVTQDSFYRELSAAENEMAFRGDFNFDHPDAFDHQLMLDTLVQMKNGQSVTIPKYNYVTNSRRTDDHLFIRSADVVLVEGILIFYHAELRNLFNMKIFVDTDPDTRLARRVVRDMSERGRELSHILHQYMKLVKPAYEEFCLPTKKYADVVIPRGAENEVAVNLIVQHIQDLIVTPKNTPSHTVGRNSPRSRHQSDSSNYVSRPH